MQKKLILALFLGLVCTTALAIPLPNEEEKKDDDTAVAETEAESDEGSADEDAGSGKKDEVPDAADSIRKHTVHTAEANNLLNAAPAKSLAQTDATETKSLDETVLTTEETGALTEHEQAKKILNEPMNGEEVDDWEKTSIGKPLENLKKEETLPALKQESLDNQVSHEKVTTGEIASVSKAGAIKLHIAKLVPSTDKAKMINKKIPSKEKKKVNKKKGKESKKDRKKKGRKHLHARGWGRDEEDEHEHSEHEGEHHHHEHEHEHDEHEHHHEHHHHGHHHGFVHEWGHEEGYEDHEHEGEHDHHHEHEHDHEHREHEHHGDHGHWKKKHALPLSTNNGSKPASDKKETNADKKDFIQDIIPMFSSPYIQGYSKRINTFLGGIAVEAGPGVTDGVIQIKQ